jgi:carotenoid cleavage dioxygenase-like enzyme
VDLSRFPYLQGNYAPIDQERDFEPPELWIEGQVPVELEGAFMRNGANTAYEPLHYVYPLDGDGMIHALYFDKGKVHYRNRWVQTNHLKTERQFDRTIYGSTGKLSPVPEEVIAAGGEPSPLKNTSNTAVILHGGKLFSLWEGGFPHLMSPGLETLGLYDYDGLLQPGDALSAHPKICPVTGELVTCTQRWDEPFFTLQIIDKNGEPAKTIPVPMEEKVIIHDLQLAGDYVVIFVPPAYHDIESAIKGEDPFRWEPEKGARVAAIHRDTGEVTWFDTDAFFSWHFCNGFVRDGKIIVDYIWLEKIPFSQNMESGLEKQTRNMHRMTLDLAAGSVTDEKVSNIYCEFSKADDRRCGLPYRYSFATASNRQWADAHGYNCTVRFDIEAGEHQLWEYGPEANAGEPVYVPNPNSENEEDGYVMCYVYNPGEDPFISVLSAGDISKGPVAKIHVPGRVPNGFHANWMQDLKLN